VLGGFATTAGWLVASRVLQGIGAALAAPSTLSLLAVSFPEGPLRNRALSIYSAFASLGMIIGMVLGGVLTGWLSWRWVFFVNVPVGAALVIGIPRVLKETERQPGRFDLPGAIASTAGMTLLVYSLIRTASVGWRDPLTIGAFAGAILLLGFFVWHEKRESHPLLPTGLFADRNRVAAYLTLLLVVAGNFGVFFFVTQFMQGVLRLSPIQAGLAYLPMAATLLVTVRLVPRLLKTMSAKSLILPGTFIQAVGILWLSRLSPASHYASGILGPMVLIGLAAGLCFMPLNMTVLSGVAKKEAGAASGFAQTMMSVGGSFGLAILVTIYGAIGHGRSAGTSPELFVRGINTAFLVAACFAVAAFLVALIVINGPRPEARPQATALPERNKSIVRRYFEMWNTGNPAHAHEILHPRWIDHAHPEIRGINDVTAALRKTLSDSPDFHIGIDAMVSEGDRVAVHSTVRQTRQGSTHTSRVMWMVRVEGDKMAEMWTAHEPVRDAS
jgi:MFS family permease